MSAATSAAARAPTDRYTDPGMTEDVVATVVVAVATRLAAVVGWLLTVWVAVKNSVVMADTVCVVVTVGA